MSSPNQSLILMKRPIIRKEDRACPNIVKPTTIFDKLKKVNTKETDVAIGTDDFTFEP